MAPSDARHSASPSPNELIRGATYPKLSTQVWKAAIQSSIQGEARPVTWPPIMCVHKDGKKAAIIASFY